MLWIWILPINILNECWAKWTVLILATFILILWLFIILFIFIWYLLIWWNVWRSCGRNWGYTANSLVVVIYLLHSYRFICLHFEFYFWIKASLLWQISCCIDRIYLIFLVYQTWVQLLKLPNWVLRNSFTLLSKII